MRKVTRQLVECYSRIVGYIRPISQWNIGMRQMFADRKFFKMPNEK